MTSVKEFFDNARFYDERMSSLLEMKKSILESTLRLTKAAKKVNVQSSNRNTTEDSIITYIAEVKKIDDAISALENARQDVVDLICCVNDFRYQTVLRLRYLENLKWESIADRMGYDIRRVYRIHINALAVASKLMNQ